MTIYYIKRIAKIFFSDRWVTGTIAKGIRWSPVWQKLTTFGHQYLSKDFHIRSSCDSPRYAYDSIVKAILKINLIL